MIGLNTSLLNQTTLENLMGDIIARKEPHLTPSAMDFKKQHLLQKVQHGIAVLVYCAKGNLFDVISSEELSALTEK
jgi:uncharacterized protein YheU (UPF0270 family)